MGLRLNPPSIQNQRDDNLKKCLFEALVRNDNVIMTMLLDTKEITNLWQSFIYAICHSSIEIIKTFIDNGAPMIEPTIRHTQTPESALFHACEHRNKDVVKLLIDNGADPERHSNGVGSEAYDKAVSEDVKQYLREQGFAPPVGSINEKANDEFFAMLVIVASLIIQFFLSPIAPLTYATIFKKDSIIHILFIAMLFMGFMMVAIMINEKFGDCLRTLIIIISNLFFTAIMSSLITIYIAHNDLKTTNCSQYLNGNSLS